MITIIANPSQIVTVTAGDRSKKKGAEMKEIGLLESHSIIIEDGIIKDIIPNSSIKSFDNLIDVTGKTILPGLTDCHTHSVFAGDRSDEFRQKLSGASYEDIALQGGGINRTVAAVRRTSLNCLVEAAKHKISGFISQGVTNIEIKSGYGLDFGNEIKILEAIKELASCSPISIIPTYLGAHTIPVEMTECREEYITQIIEHHLPYIAKNRLALFCDGFCEKTAFSPDEIHRVFTKARSLGLKIKLHTEQFNSIGGIAAGLNNNAVSLDHLEKISSSDIPLVSASDAVCVLLPGVSFFLRYGYAPARELIDSGAAVALSTDYNPGSCNISNIHLIMSLAALNMKMTIEETISAVTINAAHALGLSRTAGSIEPGKTADFAVFDTKEYSGIIYETGKNLCCKTIKCGKVIYEKI